MKEEKISVKELKFLTIDRLFCYQKILLKQLRYYLENPLYDKNDIFNTLEIIDTVNLVIINKMKKTKKNEK